MLRHGCLLGQEKGIEFFGKELYFIARNIRSENWIKNIAFSQQDLCIDDSVEVCY